MADKKGPGPVEESIRRLREMRYMTRGAGAKKKLPAAHASVGDLRVAVAAIPPTKSRAQKRAAKKRRKR